MCFRLCHQKTALLLTAFILAFVYFNLKIYNPKLEAVQIICNLVKPELSIYCYQLDAESLPDISDAQPRKGGSIFFHETSCKSLTSGKIVITSRQACAVESAARTNPNSDVYLLYTSPGVFRFNGSQSDHFLEALLSYNNVKIMHLNYENYTNNTLVQDLYQSGKLQQSYYPRSHASDILRFLTLWKYGGTYLDLDVVVLKSIEQLGGNFAGAESDTDVAAGVINFGHDGRGHRHVETCLNDLRDDFRGHEWGYNGPGVITRLLRRVCGVQNAKDMPQKDCEGFKVLPPEAFYAVPWWNWTMFFDENHLNKVLELTNDSYLIHVWNKHSGEIPVPVNSRMPYAVFARKFCPKVFESCDTYF